MALYPYSEVKLMDNYELARAYSWDVESALRLVKVEMHMKLTEFNDQILSVIREHSKDIENYEKFHSELFGRQKEDSLKIIAEQIEREKHLEDIPEEDEEVGGVEVLDQMKEKEIDYLDLIMPNLNLPKLDPDGAQKKVQFSMKKTVSCSVHSFSCSFNFRVNFLWSQHYFNQSVYLSGCQ